MKQTLVVVGAGKGLGNHIAKKFGEEGFRLILMARDVSSLARYEAEFVASGLETYVQVADAAEPESLTKAFAAVKARFGAPDVLAYNVGITSRDDKERMNAAELLRHYRTDVAGAYHCARLVADADFAAKQGAILFTGGELALEPSADYLPLSLDKAALRALAFALNKELRPQGIFVGIVHPCGTIASGTHFDPALIAESFWKMCGERKDCEAFYK